MGVLSPVVALHPSGHARSSQFGCRQWVEARAGGRDEQKDVQLVHEHTDETRLAVEQEQARIAQELHDIFCTRPGSGGTRVTPEARPAPCLIAQVQQMGLPAQLIVHGNPRRFPASSERLPHRPGEADEHPQACRRRSDHGGLELRICDDGHRGQPPSAPTVRPPPAAGHLAGSGGARTISPTGSSRCSTCESG